MLTTIADRMEIADLLVRYCRGLDRMELDDVASLFTEDCVVSYGPDPALNSAGRAGLRRDLERLWRWRRTSHHLSNVEVVVNGDIAFARSYVIGWHERADGSTATIYGTYEDELRRENGRWLIGRRTQFMNGADAGFTVNIHPAPRRPPPGGWTPPKID